MGLWGRFGNQMFQYATLLSASRKTGYEAILPIPPKNTNPYQRFVLDEAFLGLSIKHDFMSAPTKTYEEKSLRFDGNLFSIEDNTNIMGYFQSEKYFIDIADDVRSEFTFKDVIKHAVDERYSFLSNEYTVSLHVRRGDYVKLQDNHPLCTKEYYKNAVDLMPKDAKMVIISDDINWCKENLHDISSNILYSENKSSYEDMYLMTKCNANIIANSSFSWWGAWLSNNKQVVAPSKWYGEKTGLDSSDIIPERWIKI